MCRLEVEMRTTFTATVPVRIGEVKELFSDEFCRQHHITAWKGTGAWGYYRTLEIDHSQPLPESVTARFRTLSFTEAPR
jgi:hypothetical protein